MRGCFDDGGARFKLVWDVTSYGLTHDSTEGNVFLLMVKSFKSSHSRLMLSY